MQLEWFHHVTQIGADRWQQAIGATDYPFAQYAFHAALEASGSIGEQTGWYPEYLVLSDNAQAPLAIAPTYLKTHSQGEFVFDWSWAEAYQRYGMHYYPKRIWAIPFSPVSGPRLFSANTEPSVLKAYYITVANELSRRTQQQQDSSWHLLFSDSDTTATLQASLIELLPRIACQFHWFNRGYDSMAHYFSHFNSRKRKAVRKEREKIQQQGIQLRRKLGTELTSADIAFFYQCYQSTYAKRGQRGYLTQAFFIQLAQTMGEQIMLVQAYRAHTPIAASWCFFDHHSLYGRYWGCLEEIDSLHFEACYYQGIEFCLEKGLQHFDPGTQGEHKIARGFEPVFSNSLHYIDHPGFRQAIGHFCQQEAQAVKLYHQQTQQLLPFKID